MYARKCKICNKEFNSVHRDTKFCSKECMGKSYRRYDKDRVCQTCGKEFEQKSSNRGKIQKFCSRECFSKSRVIKRPILICQACGKEFTSDRKSRETTLKFCSKECYHNSPKVRPKHKEEICLYCGKEFYRPRPNNKFCSRKCYQNFITDFWDIYDGWHPGYNLKACECFKQFDIDNNTTGQYATNGGEFYIEELGYWIDYINHDLKLIIEWDEKKHFKNGQLREKDIIRQQKIQELYPNYEFKRIKE